jgi:hypothetical protein
MTLAAAQAVTSQKIKIAKSDKCHSNRVDGLLQIEQLGLLVCYRFNVFRMLLPPDAPKPQEGMIDAEAHSSLSCLDCRYSPGGCSRRTNISSSPMRSKPLFMSKFCLTRAAGPGWRHAGT